MNRKRKHPDISRLDGENRKTINQSHQKETIDVILQLPAPRPSIIIHAPKCCSMKILKNMIWFHLKKILSLPEYNNIIGVESSHENYEMDYQLEQGIGELTQAISFTPFFKNNNNQPNSLLNYKICRLLSLGGFSKVYLLRSRLTGEFLAGKFMHKETANLELINNQYQIASSLDHPFIVKTHSLLQSQNFYIMIMDYVPGGELFQLLKSHRHMNQQIAQFYMVQTLLALKYLHSQNIIYRDIKPQNIILDSQGHLKLIDFGLAKKATERSYSFCGSLDYMAPEVLEEQGYSFEVDYYSIGNLLFELLLGSPPFYHPNNTQQQTKYHILNTPVTITQTNLSPQLISLLTRLLQKDPRNRLGHKGQIDEILSHEWFKNTHLDNFSKKTVTPPFIPSVLMELPSEQSSEILNEWQTLINNDIKQLEIKATVQTRKKPYGIRHKSLEEPNEGHQRKLSSQLSPFNSPSNKPKSNISLLSMFIHKRSTSDFPRKNDFRCYLNKSVPKSLSSLKSFTHTQKNSFYRLSKSNFLRQSVLSGKKLHQPDLKTNFVLICSQKNKENGKFMRKKRKQACNFPKTKV